MQVFYQYNADPQILHNQRIYFEPHLHEEIEIIVLFQGTASLSVGGKAYTMCAGDFLMVFPDTVHSYAADTPVDVGKFIFKPECIPELQEVLRTMLPETPVIRRADGEKERLLPLAEEILGAYQSSSDAVKKGYLLLLTGKLLHLCRLEKRNRLDEDTVHQIFDYCQQHYRSSMTLGDVAAALYISKSYISHLFADRIQMHFCTYIHALRIHEAARLLRETAMPIGEVSAQSGFSSFRTFNRAFMTHMHTTPREYRKSAAG